MLSEKDWEAKMGEVRDALVGTAQSPEVSDSDGIEAARLLFEMQQADLCRADYLARGSSPRDEVAYMALVDIRDMGSSGGRDYQTASSMRAQKALDAISERDASDA